MITQIYLGAQYCQRMHISIKYGLPEHSKLFFIIITKKEIEARFKKFPWIEDACRAFDTANDLNGETPFHLSVVIGN